MSDTYSEDLRGWLRLNSSGVYRKSAEAADYIEQLEAENKSLQIIIKSLELIIKNEMSKADSQLEAENEKLREEIWSLQARNDHASRIFKDLRGK